MINRITCHDGCLSCLLVIKAFHANDPLTAPPALESGNDVHESCLVWNDCARAFSYLQRQWIRFWFDRFSGEVRIIQSMDLCSFC